MIRMKCPKCSRTAELPESLVDEEQRCFTCNVALQFADEKVAQGRAVARQHRYEGLIVGCFLGGAAIILIGTLGGKVGIAVTGAVGGAFLGALWGFVEGLLGGMEWSIVMLDSSWLSYWAKIIMGLGAIVGFVAGMLEWPDTAGQPGVLAAGTLGGLCLGGLLGMKWFGGTIR